MTLKRLLDEAHLQQTEEARLLRAARVTPSFESRARMLAGIEASAVTLGLLAADATPVSAQLAEKITTDVMVSANGASKWSWTLIAAIGTIVPAALIAWWVASRPVNVPSIPASDTVVTMPEVATPARTVSPTPAQATPVHVTPRPATSRLLPATLPTPKATHRSETASQVSLADELVVIRRARSALNQGDATTALRELDAYRARFSRGILRPEASLLRIESLLLRGDRSTATALGVRFINTYPRSPYVQRIRSMLLSSAPPG